MPRKMGGEGLNENPEKSEKSVTLNTQNSRKEPRYPKNNSVDGFSVESCLYKKFSGRKGTVKNGGGGPRVGGRYPPPVWWGTFDVIL